MDAKRFDFGYMTRELLKKDGKAGGELFLSVTPGFEHGPGIQRDGLTLPRMTDPRGIDYVCRHRAITPTKGMTSTIDPSEQRLGTWTLYDHLKAFIDNNPGYRVAAIQSNGDLTMNPWHVVYLRESHIPGQSAPILCGLFTRGDPEELIDKRTYRCLVKWRHQDRKPRYQFLPLRFSYDHNDHTQRLPRVVNLEDQKDISQEIEFALSGKTIVKRGYPVPLARAVDKFDDLRHVFNLPEKTPASGNFAGIPVKEVYFGEYQLYRNLNERRAALFGPVIVDLSIREKAGSVDLSLADVEKNLRTKRYHRDKSQISNPDQFRPYPDDNNKIEIYFSRSVYPFGAIGIDNERDDRNDKDAVTSQSIVSYLSGGISGRVGSTLEGVIDTLYSYLKCEEAMVLDEGMDCSLIVNPETKNGALRYDNDELLDKVLCFTHELTKNHPCRSEPLNKPFFDMIEDAYRARPAGPADYADVFEVKPLRPQVRSVVILAVKETA